jgi:hypothetical protein
LARPFIEFIQSQVLPWSLSVSSAVAPGVAFRVLSRDDETGAVSALVRYPADYVHEVNGALGVDEELLVLKGALEIDGMTRGIYDYAFISAGARRSLMRSERGAVALAFYSGKPELGDVRSDAAVEFQSGLTGSWGGGFHPRFPPGAGRKWLRETSPRGDQTWLLGTLPLRHGTRPEKHPVIEEMFLLSGVLKGDRGTMYPGAYFWRPPEQWHGPYGSLTGTLVLFRTIGGPLSTVYSEEEVGFSWDPRSRLELPRELAHLAEGFEPPPDPRF